MPTSGGDSATCARCGATAEPVPLTWTTQIADRGVEHLCERCTREHVRDIEAKLPTDWW